jgi:hypothetical protein
MVNQGGTKDHSHYEVRRAGQSVVAQCTCGWRSQLASNGGMAGAAWDTHVAEVTVVVLPSDAQVAEAAATADPASQAIEPALASIDTL